jgi:hypothetical protein
LVRSFALLVAALTISSAPSALAAGHATTRHPAVTREFQRLHPCPSTGRAAGACRGYVKDHIIPLCAGGADSVENMQWQTTTEAKLKDRAERKMCRALRRPTLVSG